MPNRKPIVGGNWKMNTNLAAATTLAEGIVNRIDSQTNVDIVVFPPFPYLLKVGEIISESTVAVGAQDLYHEPDGAFTGEVSIAMIRDCRCKWVLCGHSERRHVIGESDDLINRKLRASLAGGLNVILCIGETQAQRESGQTDTINISQLRAGLNSVTKGEMTNVVIAYEPVWAIGTGLTATPNDAQTAHSVIRSTLADIFDSEVAEATRIQYGGSIKPENAAELISQPDIDGGLIGGASLKPDDFSKIVAAAAEVSVTV